MSPIAMIACSMHYRCHIYGINACQVPVHSARALNNVLASKYAAQGNNTLIWFPCMNNGSHQCKVALIWKFIDILIANIIGVKPISMPIYII